MTPDWMSFAEFKTYVIKLGYSTENNNWFEYRAQFNSFLTMYPTFHSWLETPDPIKKLFPYDGLYITAFATVNGLFHDNEISPKLIDFLLYKYFARKKYRTPVQWTKLAVTLGYISTEEYEFVSKAVRSTLALHTILLAKPLRNFSDEEMNSIPGIYQPFQNGRNNLYTLTTLANIRVKLGYSTHIPTMNRGKNKKLLQEQLEEHPTCGQILKVYFKNLEVAGCGKSRLKTIRSVLKILFQFMLENGNDDFSKLNYPELLQFLGEGKTAFDRLSIIKNLLEWGVGLEKFPKTLDVFPYEEYKKRSKEAWNTYITSEGHSFQDEGDEILFVNGILDYYPQNEIEDLCRMYWLIQISCPSRSGYILNLQAFDCLAPMANEPNLFGITAEYADKAGNRYGHVPILDELGIQAIKDLQERARQKNFSPITNRENNLTYVHLFQLEKHPFILHRNRVIELAHNVIARNPKLSAKYNNDSKNKTQRSITPHKFRTHILTRVAAETRNANAVRIAANHRDNTMQRLYLRSTVSRNTLIYTLEEKFRHGEITGKFYFKIIELLTTNEPSNELETDLVTDMTMDEFILKYGKRHENRMGHCMSQSDCDNWFRCWGCNSFLLTRNEIEEAITLMAEHIRGFKEFKALSRDFSYDNSLSMARVRAIALIAKRVQSLKLPPEMIQEMVALRLKGEDIREALKKWKQNS